MTTQERIRQALDDLASAPEPANLADRALRAADRRRAATIGAAFGTGAVVVALAAIGLAGPSGPGDNTAPPAQTATTTPEPCVAYTSGSNGLAEVPRNQWPDFVIAAVAALPAPFDYSMQSGYAWCDLPSDPRIPASTGAWKISSAIITLGQNREGGVLTVDVFIRVPGQATSCADVSTPEPLLFCAPGTPLVYTYGHQDSIIAVAVLGGGVEVRMPYDGNALTAEQVAAAASDPELRLTVLDSLSNLPSLEVST